MNERVCSDALVMPSSTGVPEAGLPPFSIARVLASSSSLQVDLLARWEVGIAGLDDVHLLQHLPGNDLDVLVVDRHALQRNSVHGCRWMSREGLMKAQTANRLIEFLLDQAKQQNQFVLDYQNIIDSEDFDQVKKIIAHTMGAIYRDGLHPVLKDHPDLRPNGLKV